MLPILPAASLAASQEGMSSDLRRQIEQIDQEILLLRAELAQSNGDIETLRRYLNQLEQMTLPDSFLVRVQALKEFVRDYHPPSSEQGETLKSGFMMPQGDSTVVVLLPLTGDYAVAGEAILSGLKSRWPFHKDFIVVDSALYSSMFELWELVKLYSPDFVIGPLNKENALAWQQLNTGIATLYLNQLPVFNVNEKAIAPSKFDGLTRLTQFADDNALRHLLVLTSEKDNALQLQFQQAWLAQNPFAHYEVSTVDRGVDQGVKQGLGVSASYDRKAWLQRTLQTELEFEPRARQDLDGVITFLNMDEAVQVKPLLNFYHLFDVYHLWYPSSYPDREAFQANLPFWLQTYAFLPPYIVESVREDADAFDPFQQVGLLYALGSLVAESVNNSLILQKDRYIQHSLIGELVNDSQGQLQLLPNVYWMDDSQSQSLSQGEVTVE